ncbi:hypothetical protein MASR2M36_34970 [Providencia sp.]
MIKIIQKDLYQYNYDKNRLPQKPFIDDLKNIAQNNTLNLKNKFENFIIKKETTKNINKKNLKPEIKKPDINSFKSDICNKNIYFIYSSPHSSKTKAIDNHQELKITYENSLFINVDNILESKPEYSTYKIFDFIIRVPNKNRLSVPNDNRFTHSTILKNGKRILISAFCDYKTN